MAVVRAVGLGKADEVVAAEEVAVTDAVVVVVVMAVVTVAVVVAGCFTFWFGFWFGFGSCIGGLERPIDWSAKPFWASSRMRQVEGCVEGCVEGPLERAEARARIAPVLMGTYLG